MANCSTLLPCKGEAAANSWHLQPAVNVGTIQMEQGMWAPSGQSRECGHRLDRAGNVGTIQTQRGMWAPSGHHLDRAGNVGTV